MKIPPQYNPIMPYILVKGGAAFITYMTEVFGATVQINVPRGEGLIMHAELRVGDAVIMFADATDLYPVRTCSSFIYVASIQQVYERALERDSISLMDVAVREYGLSAGIEDPFGNVWWLAAAD